MSKQTEIDMLLAERNKIIEEIEDNKMERCTLIS